MNTSSSAQISDRYAEIPVGVIKPHPLNANVMSEDLLAKLTAHIAETDEYPPLIVRPLAERDAYQVLDGNNRLKVLKSLGYDNARCYTWPCDDAQALVLLATLNRLEGTDVPALRAGLIQELAAAVDIESLELLLPESRSELDEFLDLEPIDEAALLDSLALAAQPTSGGLTAITFAVTRENSEIIEQAITKASEKLTGTNQRGQAITSVCQLFLEDGDA
jgi:ParB-like chromosome segregation protein Spo0J